MSANTRTKSIIGHRNTSNDLPEMILAENKLLIHTFGGRLCQTYNGSESETNYCLFFTQFFHRSSRKKKTTSEISNFTNFIHFIPEAGDLFIIKNSKYFNTYSRLIFYNPEKITSSK